VEVGKDLRIDPKVEHAITDNAALTKSDPVKTSHAQQTLIFRRRRRLS